MQRITGLFALLLFSINLLQAQTTILHQSMQTPQSFGTFTSVSVTGIQNWYYNPVYGAVCSGFAGGMSHENEDWLISPVMNLSEADNVKLTFDHTRGNQAVINVGVAEGWYKAFATSNYTGDPLTTEWIEIENVNMELPAAWQYISSGELIIPEIAKSESSRIAFRYISSSTQSATWEIRNIKVTGEIATTPGSETVFKITNWNTEWLGCTLFGPDDESLQLVNVASAMLAMNSDVYCMQEVSNTSLSPTINALVALLGPDQWGGSIVPSDTGNCNQRQGIIYKKSKVQFVSAFELSSGSPSHGNSYYYNWSSGRYPALYNVNLIAGSTSVPVSIINIHAKAEDGDAMSYTRRLGASESLKEILDGAEYNSKNVMVVGDFNDYLIGTTSNVCGCSTSPYQNFMEDTGQYTGVTANLIDVNITWEDRPVIEHLIISDELTGTFVNVAQDVAVSQAIDGYYFTTSNHLPVTATFDFSSLSTPEPDAASLLSVYPVPATNELNIRFANTNNETMIAIYDWAGRKIYHEAFNGNAIDVSGLSSGIYIINVDGVSRKFYKN